VPKRILLQKILSSTHLRRFNPEPSHLKAACMENPFTWRHYQFEVILTIYRRVQRYAPELDKLRSKP